MSSAAIHDAALEVSSSQTPDLAEIIRRYGPTCTFTHLTLRQYKVLNAIVDCRTAALGGHREWCDDCGFKRYYYHSCRNRHCPKCQSIPSEEWAYARCSELLPVPYFHQVFTLPHELNPFVLWSEKNQEALLSLLFHAAAQTILQFGKNELGGKMGLTLILHTWNQQLQPHYHVHGIVPSGALSDDKTRWIAGGNKFLFKVHALSKVFRAKYLQGFERLIKERQLSLPPQFEHLAHEDHLDAYIKKLKKKAWTVYSKAPFASPKKLIDYLSRYTHRTAISNHRIMSCEDGNVTFSYRDRQDGNQKKSKVLPVNEFISRFLKHVLSKNFMRIRHYGILANRDRTVRLALCRKLLGCTEYDLPEPPQTTNEWMLELTDFDATRCPCCGEPLQSQEIKPRRLVRQIRYKTYLQTRAPP